MRLLVERPTPAWSEVTVALNRDEIDELIGLLEAIRDDAEQHFHLTSSTQEGAESVQLTFSQEVSDDSSNARMSSLALPPGSEV